MTPIISLRAYICQHAQVWSWPLKRDRQEFLENFNHYGDDVCRVFIFKLKVFTVIFIAYLAIIIKAILSKY